MLQVKLLVRLLRPHQWLKNGFVLIGLLFSHSWRDPTHIGEALYAFAIFCLLASAVYVMNDLVDRDQDRKHPAKRHRPLASGAIGVPKSLALMVACFGGGFGLLMLSGNRAPWVFFTYVALNILYTLGLKHVVILDVFIIAAGFMLRILAGTLGIGIDPSQWLLLCGLMLTLFLGFAKRRAEISVLDERDAVAHRRVLEDYSLKLLDQLMTVTVAGTIVSYSLYTVSADTVALHGTTHLIYTVPVVIYGMFRYLFLLHRRGGGGDPAQQLLADAHLLAALLIWLALVLAILRQGL